MALGLIAISTLLFLFCRLCHICVPFLITIICIFIVTLVCHTFRQVFSHVCFSCLASHLSDLSHFSSRLLWHWYFEVTFVVPVLLNFKFCHVCWHGYLSRLFSYLFLTLVCYAWRYVVDTFVVVLVTFVVTWFHISCVVTLL